MARADKKIGVKPPRNLSYDNRALSPDDVIYVDKNEAEYLVDFQGWKPEKKKKAKLKSVKPLKPGE